MNRFTGKGPASVSHPPFDLAIENKAVSIRHVVNARSMESSVLGNDPPTRAIGRRYYPLLLTAYEQAHPGAQCNFQAGAGVGAVLLADGDGTSSRDGKKDSAVDGELLTVVLRNTIHYDWSAARDLQAELNRLDEDAKRWVPAKERRGVRLAIYGVITQLHTEISRENRQHKPDKPGDPPTAQMTSGLKFISRQIASVRDRLEQDAQQAAQITYAEGMAEGGALLSILSLALVGAFICGHVSAVNGVGVIAGAVGACLSVLQRMTSGSLELNYKSDKTMLRLFGGLRPFVGAVFGTVTFCVIKSGVLSTTLVIPHEISAQLALVALLAFAAGFNERFFQDMLNSATKGLG